jgi:hypothetical protein
VSHKGGKELKPVTGCGRDPDSLARNGWKKKKNLFVPHDRDCKNCKNYGMHANSWDSRGEQIERQLLHSLVFLLGKPPLTC